MCEVRKMQIRKTRKFRRITLVKHAVFFTQFTPAERRYIVEAQSFSLLFDGVARIWQFVYGKLKQVR